MTISIAKDYSAFPAGRVPEDGDFDGQTFREEILLPKLKEAIDEGAQLLVSLDDLQSCGSSFLDSAFGGLIRYDGIAKHELERTMKVVFSHRALERYKLAIDKYVSRATAE